MPFCSERCRLIDLGNWASREVRDSVADAGLRRGRKSRVEARGREGRVDGEE